MSVEDISKMHMKTINTTWDMYPDYYHSFDDISMNKVQRCIDLLKRKGMSIEESGLKFIEKYDLIKDGRLTYGAFLLFKQDYKEFSTIELGIFQDEITIKDSKRSKSDIITQVDEIFNYVKMMIKCEIIIVDQIPHIEKWDYPLDALREIIINMIIHRDYSSPSDSIIKIFDNKIEFYNPGRLPDGITVEDLLSNNYKSIQRNSKIACVFKDFGWIEKYGSGVRRIIQYFKEENLPPPEFKNISVGFQVSVYTNRYKPSENFPEKLLDQFMVKFPDKVLEKAHEQYPEFFSEKFSEKFRDNNKQKLPQNQLKIIEMIMKNKYITVSEIAKIINISERSIWVNLSKLKDKGILERIGPDKGGYWQVISEAK